MVEKICLYWCLQIIDILFLWIFRLVQDLPANIDPIPSNITKDFGLVSLYDVSLSYFSMLITKSEINFFCFLSHFDSLKICIPLIGKVFFLYILHFLAIWFSKCDGILIIESIRLTGTSTAQRSYMRLTLPAEGWSLMSSSIFRCCSFDCRVLLLHLRMKHNCQVCIIGI